MFFYLFCDFGGDVGSCSEGLYFSVGFGLF